MRAVNARPRLPAVPDWIGLQGPLRPAAAEPAGYGPAPPEGSPPGTRSGPVARRLRTTLDVAGPRYRPAAATTTGSWVDATGTDVRAIRADRGRGRRSGTVRRPRSRTGFAHGGSTGGRVHPAGADPRATPRLGHTSPVATVDLNGIQLRNRLLTCASLLGYGASKSRLILYGLSPIAQWVPLERFGAVTTRTVIAPAARGPLHAPGGLGPARVPGDAAALRAGAAQGRRRLAQRLRLVEHRHRALLRRVLRPDGEPQPDRVRGRLQRGRDRAADRDRATSGRSRARSRRSSSTPPATTSTSRSRRSSRRRSAAPSRRAATR